jgi:hypothetical protein
MRQGRSAQPTESEIGVTPGADPAWKHSDQIRSKLRDRVRPDLGDAALGDTHSLGDFAVLPACVEREVDYAVLAVRENVARRRDLPA